MCIYPKYILSEFYHIMYLSRAKLGSFIYFNTFHKSTKGENFQQTINLYFLP